MTLPDQPVAFSILASGIRCCTLGSPIEMLTATGTEGPAVGFDLQTKAEPEANEQARKEQRRPSPSSVLLSFAGYKQARAQPSSEPGSEKNYAL
ncbi:hypothetical protein UM93_15575 [Psychromicrobium lacuslunae]|uniref:Uncharacterized protein n=2 Tax=Psychromicrobium lacuslunae TaxID=1618207 RepID=A0A0D4C1Z0_9MICC|nr:hypothetical protein UM93_15575 [Psychromicrobium lacuslunae]